MKLLNGDCLVEMQKMIDEGVQVDSVVTDPPYELGFMAKKWDSTGIAFQKETWELAYQLLKPGGYLLSFGGSRTYHRMAVAIEDAGFEIRDQLMWLYGCLSEDTEILTDRGWVHYHKDINSSNVLCYDIIENRFEFNKPTESYYYENKHPAYRIESDKTDQIVSKNHRVIVERDGRKIFQRAETCQFEENIPFLESLSDLPDTIYYSKSHTSIKKQNLLDRVQKQSDRIKTEKKNWYQTFSRNFLFRVRKQSNKTKRQSEFKSNMFLSLQRFIAWSRMEIAWPQGEVLLDGTIRKGFERTNDGFDKSLMERWYHLSTQTRKLQGTNIGKMSTEFFRNVEEMWLRFRTSIGNGSISQSIIGEKRGGASYRSRSSQQQDRKLDVIQKQQRTQIVRGTRATIKEIKYKGHVWCVTVSTGAFVARRNNKIFITGNSGFPKSLNIGKAVDKLQGNEREDLGEYEPFGREGRKSSGKAKFGAKGWETKPKIRLTKGNSEYEGWGTALKPAHEPVVMARKPLAENTVAENVLKHGTGGINIDGCRIPLDGERPPSGRTYGTNKTTPESGRYPANVIHDGLEQEWARFFYCAKVSKNERNGGLDGFADTRAGIRKNVHCKRPSARGISAFRRMCLNRVIERKNTHPTVKPQVLMKYLCRLVTPKSGTVLDPFMGSGSTGMAAKDEGFDFIGIEQEKEYFEIAKQRIKIISPLNEFFEKD